MDGLYIRKNDACLETVTKNSDVLRLLARGDGAEIMLQDIEPDKLFKLMPSDQEETMEFFYVLNGEIEAEHDGQKDFIKAGDHFYLHHLKGIAYFKTITKVRILYVSTQPVFHFLSHAIKELNSMVKSVEEKDLYTLNHSKRVKTYSVAIAKELKLSDERLDVLTFAALFHDIGKKNVPDEILNKPGRLTADEMNYIKQHPNDGRDLVAGTFLWNIGKIIEQHHERIDGSGYPSGLRGEETVLEAKIIAVVDSYDAMTTDRPYRKGMSSEDAIAELKRLSGVTYDPLVVNTFARLLEKGIVDD